MVVSGNMSCRSCVEVLSVTFQRDVVTEIVTEDVIVKEIAIAIVTATAIVADTTTIGAEIVVEREVAIPR